jgi:hypothetical protein
VYQRTRHNVSRLIEPLSLESRLIALLRLLILLPLLLVSSLNGNYISSFMPTICAFSPYKTDNYKRLVAVCVKECTTVKQIRLGANLEVITGFILKMKPRCS